MDKFHHTTTTLDIIC